MRGLAKNISIWDGYCVLWVHGLVSYLCGAFLSGAAVILSAAAYVFVFFFFVDLTVCFMVLSFIQVMDVLAPLPCPFMAAWGKEYEGVLGPPMVGNANNGAVEGLC